MTNEQFAGYLALSSLDINTLGSDSDVALNGRAAHEIANRLRSFDEAVKLLRREHLIHDAESARLHDPATCEECQRRRIIMELADGE